MRTFWLSAFAAAFAVAILYHGKAWLVALAVAALLAYFAPDVWGRS